MKTFRIQAIVAGIAIPFLALAAIAPAAEDANIAKTVAAEAAANPSSAPVIAAEHIYQHPEQACEIVKAAIRGSDADAELTSAILDAAIRVVPDQTPLLIECALVANPKAREQIVSVVRAAYVSAAPGKNPVVVRGKTPIQRGKQPVGKVEVVEPAPVGLVPLHILSSRYAGFGPALINSFILNPQVPAFSGSNAIFELPPVFEQPPVEIVPPPVVPPRPRPPFPRPVPPATPADPEPIIPDNGFIFPENGFRGL